MPNKGQCHLRNRTHVLLLLILYHLEIYQSPVREPSDRKGLSIRDVEIEHLKTSVISLHEEFRVVEDLHKDVKNLREKE